jgi:hypothetical protein
MSLRSTVRSNVRKAFSAIKDLAIDITLQQSDSSSFNFRTASAEQTAVVSTVIKGVVIEKKRDKREIQTSEANTLKAEIIVITADISDLTIYDTAVFEGKSWKVIQPVKDNGYIVVLDVARTN